MFLNSLLDPPILFFLLGASSVLFGSDLKIPRSIGTFLALYLLMSLGFKGGVALVKNGIGEHMIAALTGGVIFACAIPYTLFHLLKKKYGSATAAAVGASYGSVSAVTFVTATTWLEARDLNFDGSMIAILAIMEAPAIIMSIFLLERESPNRLTGVWKLIKKSFLNSSVFLLVGSLLVGVLSGAQGQLSVGSFLIDLFKGFLGFFLLDMGIKTASQLKNTHVDWSLLVIGLMTPLAVATLTLFWCYFTGMGGPESLLLVSLNSSGSYIVVPAAIRSSIPNANPGIFLTLALGITFPFNILIGIPLYWEAIQIFIIN